MDSSPTSHTAAPVPALTIPPLRRRYPLRRSAHYDAALADEVDTWFLSFGLPTPQQQAYRRTNHAYLAAVCWPSADRRTLADLARLAAAVMARDHEIDSAPHPRALAAARSFLNDARHHFTPHADSDPRWAPVFINLWQRIATHRTDRFMDRLADAIATYLTGCLTWLQTTANDSPPAGLDAYLATRRTTIAQRVDHLLTEMSLGLDLSPAALAHSLTKRLHALDVERTILVQDLLSAPKELADGETENLLTVLAAERQCTFAEALPDALRLYEQAMDAYDHAHHQLLHTELGRQPPIRAYLNALNDFNTGLIEWTTHSPRYARTAQADWTTPDEIIQPADAALPGSSGRADR
ncbi:terpene synthase family protein [Streptomyces bullii]|uniref:Terpene synthase n=1 Tax=Streptomyces bullii TaxID=349910 RepID=A0ABW0V0K3_9ACTN